MESPKITQDIEKAREDHEREAIAAFESVTDAIAAQIPELALAERGRIARMLIDETVRQVPGGGCRDRQHPGQGLPRPLRCRVPEAVPRGPGQR